MPPPRNVAIVATTETDDLALRSFQRLWEKSDVDLVHFWKGHRASHPLTLLTALIKVDIAARFERGLRPTAAEYLALFPELAADRDRVVSIVYEEFCLLEDRDEHPDVDQFCALYEAWDDSLRSQLNCHREISQLVCLPKPRVRYPEVGERFGDYHLRSILGRGGAAQVYLASDSLVGDREVVLKVSDSIGLEPTILARLKHKNIVPILTVAESPGSGLRGICMPYLPGETLDSVLRTITAARRPRRAKTILDQFRVLEPDEDIADNAWKDFPTGGTYTEGVAWLGVKIANALYYLHQQGICHRDIKPANILLTHQDGPLLFDFNLAHSPNSAQSAQDAATGGTLPYAAPEQLRAFIDPNSWGGVGAPADIYAFGLLLREMVTGRKPFSPDVKLPLDRAIRDLLDRRMAPVGSCQEIQPDVPPSLDAIISKCLKFAPVDRYASARELSLDLRCFLKRRPLIVADNSSWLEMVVNLGCRGRKLMIGASLVGVLTVGAVGSRMRMQASNPPLVKQAAAPALERPIRALPRFQHAVSLFRLAGPEQLSAAKQEFLALSEAYPESALPLLYLGMIAEKQSDEVKLKNYLKETLSKLDGIAVVNEQVLESPNNISLRIALAEYYRERKNWDQAEKEAQAALDHDPNHLGPLVTMANLKRDRRDYDEAIKLYHRVIEQASSKTTPHQYVSRTRAQLVAVMITQINKRLARQAGSPRDLRVASRRWVGVDQKLVDLGHELEILTAEWELENGKPLPDETECSLLSCQAALMSAQGYLHYFNDRESEAREAFRLTAAALDRARKTASSWQHQETEASQPSEHKRILDQVKQLESELKQRLLDCQIDPASL